MAQIYGASFPQSKFLSSLRRAGEAFGGEVTKRQASLAGWHELPGDVSMRPDRG